MTISDLSSKDAWEELMKECCVPEERNLVFTYEQLLSLNKAIYKSLESNKKNTYAEFDTYII